jgi:poly-gamma-glutamate synthesis protein (capsule biosynthesis protein)
MDKLEHETAKGAAMFRNRITTMQHNQHLADTMTRIVNGTIDTAPQWAYDRVKEWMTRRISDDRFSTK